VREGQTRASTLWLASFAAGCATLAGAETGGENLPNAAAGPFRAVCSNEMSNLRSAPNVLEDEKTFPRDPAVIDADGDPTTPLALGFFSYNPEVPGKTPDPAAPSTAIVRFRALDGRSFDRSPVVVLEPSATWEGQTIGAPSVVRVGTEFFLYYAAEGGIGLARSTDGEVFQRDPKAEQKPLFGADPKSWEAGAIPKSPGVLRLDDGSFRMFYEVSGKGIGEARSEDGLSWERVSDAAILEPSLVVDEENPPPDSAFVGAPFPVLAKTAEGRPVLRVYYAARDTLGHAVIALAARFDPSGGPLSRATSPVFGTSGSLGPTEPDVLVSAFSSLFVTQLAGRTKSARYPAIAAGLAPAERPCPKDLPAQPN